ncbi:MAG: FAD-dependent oxidoreductase [Deltaproteobacteria bacterium]|nr:FAD-dependent oxidoreductase [Deltaproteobacteria bacterium]
MEENIVYSTDPEDFYYVDINVPCQSACPADTNIPAYIRALFEGECQNSYDINRAANILPGVLGRICSRPCEDKCRHGEAELGLPVDICHIKRAASDFREGAADSFKLAPRIHKKVGIVGSGPAGLAAAHDLACLGFSVTVYEAMGKPGGMLRYGIPEFRLPRQVLDMEIEAILRLGVTIQTGVRVGEDIEIDELLIKHDALLSATGCYRSLSLNVPGESLAGVHSGLEFMIKVCRGETVRLGDRVLVIGAGFTAFDCARTALRLGAKEVNICLRRTEEDLRVTRDEIFETKREGVRIGSLMLAKRILGQQRTEGVEFFRTRPDEKRDDGKRDITPIEGSEFVIKSDSVIVATGQRPGPFEAPGEKDENGLIIADRESFRTSRKGLYVTGDYLTGPSTVIEAVAMGRKAAHRIARDLTGETFYDKAVRLKDSQRTDRKRPWDYLPRQEMPTLVPIEKRFEIPDREVETGYSKEQSREEAKRCYLCYLHYEIDMDRCIYCRYCMDVAPRDCIKLVNGVETNEDGAIVGFVETSDWEAVNAVIIDNKRCIRCGECVRVCPMDCISVTKVELVDRKI